MTTMNSGRDAPSAPPRAGERRFRATLRAPIGAPFTLRTAALFEGLAIVLVDREGEPAAAGTDAAAVHGVFKSPPFTVGDNVFSWVDEVELHDEGQAVRFVFEPIAHATGAVSGLFRDILKEAGVVEVRELTRE